jgi:hypothetical protein
VVRDRHNHRVDFHTVTFDATGAATQHLQDGTMAPYPAQGFSGFGLGRVRKPRDVLRFAVWQRTN